MKNLTCLWVFALTLLLGQNNPIVRVRSAVAPRYPLIAYSAGTTGTVRVDVKIDQSGQVKAVNIVDGPSRLTRAAKQAAALWRFTVEPGQVPEKIRLQFHFSISGDSRGIASSYQGGYEIQVFGEEETEVVLADPPIDMGTPLQTPRKNPKK